MKQKRKGNLLRGGKGKEPFRPGEPMSRKIIRDFLIVRAITTLAMLFVFLIVYLACGQYVMVHDAVEKLLWVLLGGGAADWVMEHNVQTFLLLYLAAFLITAVVFSVITLVNFNKTWMSLPAIVNDEAEIAHFSKSFSDVEIALKDIRHQAFRSQQLAQQEEARKNDLVMYLAHDLKTPLTSVIGYLTLLRECPELPTAQRAKYLGITLEKANRLEQLITEFFEITRFNLTTIQLERGRIDLGMMLHQITDEFYPMLKAKGLSVQIELPQRIVMFADADKIARVLDNLLKNAVAYSYENTRIRIGAVVQDEQVRIKFRNHCDRISEEKLARIFDKFFRVDAARSSDSGGSGLGLAIAKQIVELHGGTISAQSTDQYTDFEIRLPFENAELPPEYRAIAQDDAAE